MTARPKRKACWECGVKLPLDKLTLMEVSYWAFPEGRVRTVGDREKRSEQHHLCPQCAEDWV